MWTVQVFNVCFLFVQVFCVPVEERRFKEMMEQQFGEKGGTQAKICSNIMAETGTVYCMLMHCLMMC